MSDIHLPKNYKSFQAEKSLKHAKTNTQEEKQIIHQEALRQATFFQQTTFYNTVAALNGLHEPTLPEIAFVGRSNAGKSSSINILCWQKSLAFASKMPGRTQHLNFFNVQRHKEDIAYLVDLPGYGFSQASKTLENYWIEFLSVYLQERKSLAGLVLIIDIRRGLTELDEYMLQWFLPSGKPICILLNKADKLGHQQQQKQLQIVKKSLETLYHKEVLKQVDLQLFSTTNQKWLPTVVNKLKAWLKFE